MNRRECSPAAASASPCRRRAARMGSARCSRSSSATHSATPTGGGLPPSCSVRASLPSMVREDRAMAQRTALITGASSGIGEAAARRLARDYRVIVLARREDRLRTLAQEIGGDHIAVDLTSDDAPQVVLSKLGGGPLHLLVNNAGAAWRGRFGDVGADNVRQHMALNFDAQLRLTEALLPLLRENAPSAIVNVSSVAGKIGRANSAAYSASKAALGAWSDGLFLEERPNGVHVGHVLPGFVATEGFPQKELVSSPLTHWAVSTPEK